MTLELRLRSAQDSLGIEDVVVLESNPADASLERCVAEMVQGRQISAPGMVSGRAFRIRWPIVKSLE